MTSRYSTLEIIVLNFFLITIWNTLVFIFSVNIDKRRLDPNGKIFKEKSWEKSGKFYTETLLIKKWKDHLPQHIGRNGFSKRHLIKFSRLSIDYIQEFILETCRAEWNHFMCCFFALISFAINSFYYALLFSCISIMTNLPFIFIQRYNRIRLRRLLHKKLRTPQATH